MNKKIFLVLPCYNEELVLEDSSNKLTEVMQDMVQRSVIHPESKICFVNDGSSDRTWEMIDEMSHKNPMIIGINLAHNVGHQRAILAGLLTVQPYCDAAITLDADLQHDIYALEKFINLFYSGNEIVYGVRKSRESGKESLFKQITGNGFYKLMRILGADLITNHADYRLMSARAIKELSKFHEVNLFLRGLIPMIGLQHTTLEYEEKERIAGTSKFTLKKMLMLATDGITSLSIKPIHFITGFGIGVSILSFIGVIYAVVSRLIGNTAAGWASMTCILCFLGGIQLISLGVLGEYIGKIYMEVKGRPRYIISQQTWKDKE